MEDRYLEERASSKNALIKSKEIANSSFINVENVEYHPNIDSYEIKADIKDMPCIYKTELSLNLKNKTLMNFSCSCASFQNSHKACKHILALVQYAYNVIKYKQNFPKYSKEATSQIKRKYKIDKKLSSLINKNIEQNYNIDKFDNAEKIYIIPSVKIENKIFYVKFYISSEKSRQYVLNDFSNFVQNMEEESFFSYGKSLSFIHEERIFDKLSLNIAFWIRDNYKEFVFKNKSIALNPKQIDSFFKAIDNYKLNIDLIENTKTFQKKYTVVNKDVDINIFIKKLDKDYFLIKIKNIDGIFEGERKLLLFSDSNVFILSKSYSQKIKEFLYVLTSNKKGSILKIEDMYKFVNSYIPSFNGKISIEDIDDLGLYPETLKAEFYFDRLDNNDFSLYINYIYGQSQYPYVFNEQKNYTQMRDFNKENKIENIIYNYFVPSLLDKRQLISNDEEKQFLFLSKGMEELSNYGEIYASDSFKNVSVIRKKSIHIGIKLNMDGILIDMSNEKFDGDISDIYSSFFEGKKYHRLKNGSFISIRENAIYEYFDIVKKLGINPKDIKNSKLIISRYKSLYLDELLKNSHNIGVEFDNNFKQMLGDINNIKYSDIVLPEDIENKIRPYQAFGFRWLRTLYKYGMGGVLADDMGLGKTLQVITLILSNIENGAQKKNLVVCPASLIYNWKSEIEKFTNKISTLIINGNASERLNQLKNINNANVVITSYDSLKRDILNYKDLNFDMIISDEAQYIKNHDTLNSKLLRSLKSNVRFALTGTPIENRLSELWSIFDFIMPGYLLKHSEFVKKFEIPITLQGDEEVKNTLKRIISPFILRRLKKDVLMDLPEKSESIIYAKMEENQNSLYNKFLIGAQNRFVKNNINDKSSAIQILAMLTKLRQIACDPKLLNNDKYFNIQSSKKELCMELIGSSIEAGHRMIIFSSFSSMIDILSNELKNRKIEHSILVGSTQPYKRHSIVQQFNSSNIPVMLISLKAGGVGLNLTGADTVIHYDPWWNLSAQNQATDRAYRIGQKNNVQVYKLITKDTIEEKILNLQTKKGELAETMLTNSENILKQITIKDILEVLR